MVKNMMHVFEKGDIFMILRFDQIMFKQINL